MAGFTLRSRLAAGEKIHAAWQPSAHARAAEVMARAGFDAVLFDMQHGETTLPDVRDAIAACHLAGRPSGVRVRLDGYAEAARCLDLGAEIAIMPMVDTQDDAARLAGALKYPPVGGRSWGPGRAAELLGLDSETYRRSANEGCVVLAMVETRAAVENLDAILSVPGLDGVFVGPSDLSISLSNGAELDQTAPAVIELLHRVVARAKAVGKITGVYCADGAAARRNAEIGIDLLAIGSDLGFLANGARAALAAARGTGDDRSAGY